MTTKIFSDSILPALGVWLICMAHTSQAATINEGEITETIDGTHYYGFVTSAVGTISFTTIAGTCTSNDAEASNAVSKAPGVISFTPTQLRECSDIKTSAEGSLPPVSNFLPTATVDRSTTTAGGSLQLIEELTLNSGEVVDYYYNGVFECVVLTGSPLADNLKKIGMDSQKPGVIYVMAVDSIKKIGFYKMCNKNSYSAIYSFQY